MSCYRFYKPYQQQMTVAGAVSRIGHITDVSIEVDWSGTTMQSVEPVTGTTTIMYSFVDRLPFSSYSGGPTRSTTITRSRPRQHKGTTNTLSENS